MLCLFPNRGFTVLGVALPLNMARQCNSAKRLLDAQDGQDRDYKLFVEK